MISDISLIRSEKDFADHIYFTIKYIFLISNNILVDTVMFIWHESFPQLLFLLLVVNKAKLDHNITSSHRNNRKVKSYSFDSLHTSILTNI